MVTSQYPTLKSLQDAYRIGEIPVDDETDEVPSLMLDNDSVSLYAGGEQVFEMDPQDVLEAALDLLGIPHDHV